MNSEGFPLGIGPWGIDPWTFLNGGSNFAILLFDSGCSFAL